MPGLPILGNPYQGQSSIASNQRCVNLYAEKNNDNPQAPSPITYYHTPGLVSEAQAPANTGKTRCTYRSSLGTAYVVIDTTVYVMLANGTLSIIGTVTARPSQIIMADNGQVVVLVDGVSGWVIDIATNAFAQIIDPNFYGAAYVIYLDTFFVFNRPDTNQFYISLSNVDYAMLTGGTGFDPLDIAAKSGSADHIVFIATVHKELWLVGELTTEVWIGTGAADFYFQIQQGAYIDHGCVAPYSEANTDIVMFFLMQDRAGSCMVVQAGNYEIKDIGTPYLTAQFKTYESVSDAIGFIFQISDHAFYALIFPTANKSWLYNLETGFWSEWAWNDPDTGILNRHRANCGMFCYGKNYIGDWENGKIYRLDAEVNNDDGNPIVRIRTAPHLIGQEYNRVVYKTVDAYMETGTSPQVDVDAGEELPNVYLSWSDNGGRTYGNRVPQSGGNQGDYDTVPSWNRLGQGRDRIFKLEWSFDFKTALNEIFVEAIPCLT